MTDPFTPILSILLAVLLERAPVVSPWFQTLSSSRKRVVILVLLFVLSTGSLLISCAPGKACFPPGEAFGKFVEQLIVLGAGNQVTYLLTKRA